MRLSVFLTRTDCKERWLNCISTLREPERHDTSRTIRTMSANADLRVYAGNNFLLPGSQVPRPATVLVSTKTGKIIDVQEGRHVKADYADIASDDNDRWIDLGDKYLLPGLVEYVRLTTRPVARPSGQRCFPSRSASVRMCTSTNLGGRIGRASGRARVRLRLGALPPSWTCRSTRFRRRPRWRTLPRNVVRRVFSAGQTLHSGVASSQAIKCAVRSFTCYQSERRVGSVRSSG